MPRTGPEFHQQEAWPARGRAAARPASGRSDRWTAATLALAAQAGLVILLLFSGRSPPSLVKAGRELIFVLPRLQKTEPAPAKPQRIRQPPSPLPSAPIKPPLAIPSFAPAPLAPSPEQLRALGQSIFGCALENRSSLGPEQRAHCPRLDEGAAQEAPNITGGPSHVKDAAHWQEELRRERAPTLLLAPGNAYPEETYTSDIDKKEHEMQTAPSCPPVSELICLHDVITGDPQPGDVRPP